MEGHKNAKFAMQKAKICHAKYAKSYRKELPSPLIYVQSCSKYLETF